MPNPPCQPWCTFDHPEDDFSSGAAFLCVRTVVNDGDIEVDLQQYQSGDHEPVGVITTNEPQVWFSLPSGENHRSFEDAIEIGERFLMAVREAKALAEGKA
jgi:hypothetical protein